MKVNDLTKKEPLLVNKDPVANNNMTSRALFFQRKLYDKVALKDEEKNTIDLWYEKPFYGKADETFKALYVSEAFLKQLPTNNPIPLYALNFVVDAFTAMAQRLSYLKSRGALKEQGPFYNLQVNKAWVNPSELYHILMETVHYSNTIKYISDLGLNNRIYDLKSFINVLTEYVDIETPRIPFTRSKAILSNKLTPMITGLAIELSDSSHGSDKQKVDTFIKDPNFKIFKDTAMRYGFRIDKHAPWRLVADIGSVAMKPYMDKYGVDKFNVFDKYFYSANILDLDLLKTYITEFYNSYVNLRPEVIVPEFKISCKGVKVVTKTKQRSLQKSILKNIQHDDQIWIRMYVFLRAREENKNWNQSRFERVVRNAYNYYISKGKDACLEYIDKRCQGTYETQKNRDFLFWDPTK